MLNFSEFLIEQTQKKPSKEKYIPHAEELSIDNHDGVAIIDKHLRGLSHMLSGGKQNDIKAKTKWSGAPSFTVGIDNNRKHYVSINDGSGKVLKNFSLKDIETNHKNDPELKNKLKQIFTHIPKILPKDMKPDEQFHGDFMYGEGDVQSNRLNSKFKPHDTEYSVTNKSHEGNKVLSSKLGIILHSRTKRGKSDDLDDKHRERFLDHPDIHNMNNSIHINPDNFTPQDRKKFMHQMELARIAYNKVKPETFETIKNHGKKLKDHIEDSIKKGEEASVDSYINSLGKGDPIRHKSSLEHIHMNKKHFQSVLDTHHALQKAKDILVGIMNKNSPYKHKINDISIDPEGFFTVDKQGNTLTHVNRKDKHALKKKLEK